ncbi:MAG: hypothetical protein IKU97_05485 [Tidjanibacter sp.]|nr:hypothetical protein [Tidjanibacter sp.]
MKNILTTLSQLEQMLAQPAVEFSVIERDIVLEKLRKLYEQTLGLEPAQSVEPAQQEESAPEIVEVAPIAVAVAEEQVVAEEPAVEEPIEESVIELIEEIIDQVEELPETEEDEEIEEEVEEPTEELIVEEEPVVEEEFVIEEEPVVEEPVAPKAKIDHKRVLSLYDDDDETPIIEAPAEDEPAVEEFAEEEPVVEEESIEEPIEEEIVFEMDMTLDEEEIAPAEEVVVEIEEEQVEVELAVEEPAEEPIVEEPIVEEPAAPAVEEIRTVVLADVLGGEQTTLAEAMSVAQTPDVASVAAAATTSLMKSISINDKVLLMRDLFGGDSRMYEQAMEVLDSYESLDEAMLFIYDNFDWNPNSEGAKLLMELLSRKLL